MTSLCQRLARGAENWTDVRRREVVFAALAAVGLALAMHWPLPLHLGRDVARDLGDPLPPAAPGRATSVPPPPRPGRSPGTATRCSPSRSTSSRPTSSGR